MSFAQLRPAYDSGLAQLRSAYFDQIALAVQSGVDASNIDPSTVVVTDEFAAEPSVYARFVTGQSWRHFYFGLTGASGKQPTFDVDGYGTHLSGSAFTSEWSPCWTADFQTWHHATTRTQSSTSITWQFDDPFPVDTVYVMSAPMAPNSHAAQVAAWLLANFSEVASPAASANSSGVYNVTAAESNSFGRACGGNNQYAISLSWNDATTDGGPKRKLVMMAGIHAAGEHKSWIGFLAALQWMLLEESSDAQAFRANWDVWLYFNVTPNGIVAGHTRTNPTRSTDPNRDFSISGTSALAEINALRAAIVSDTGGSADAVIGWHGADARSTRFNLFLVPDDYAAGTRSSAIQEFMDAGTAIFGVAPSLVESDAVGTHAKWGTAVLGAKISLAAEMQGRGDNTLEEAQFIGQAWVKTLQAVDAAGEFWSVSSGVPTLSLPGVTEIGPTSARPRVTLTY